MCLCNLSTLATPGANIGSSQQGRLGIFATVCLMPRKHNKKSTQGRYNTRDPVFYELFCFKMTLSAVMEKDLRIKFFNRPGIFCKAVPVGECLIKMYDYDMTASNVIWQNLRQCRGQRVRIYYKWHTYAMTYLALLSLL